MPDDLLDLSTLGDAHSTQGTADLAPLVRLTVLGHPSAARVGDVVVLRELSAPGGSAAVSRAEPIFRGASGAHPLRTPFLSRRPLTLTRQRGGLRLDPGELAGRIRLEGHPLAAPATATTCTC